LKLFPGDFEEYGDDYFPLSVKMECKTILKALEIGKVSVEFPKRVFHVSLNDSLGTDISLVETPEFPKGWLMLTTFENESYFSLDSHPNVFYKINETDLWTLYNYMDPSCERINGQFLPVVTSLKNRVLQEVSDLIKEQITEETLVKLILEYEGHLNTDSRSLLLRAASTLSRTDFRDMVLRKALSEPITVEVLSEELLSNIFKVFHAMKVSIDGLADASNYWETLRSGDKMKHSRDRWNFCAKSLSPQCPFVNSFRDFINEGKSNGFGEEHGMHCWKFFNANDQRTETLKLDGRSFSRRYYSLQKEDAFERLIEQCVLENGLFTVSNDISEVRFPGVFSDVYVGRCEYVYGELVLKFAATKGYLGHTFSSVSLWCETTTSDLKVKDNEW
jgi:hypothetical protein